MRIIFLGLFFDIWDGNIIVQLPGDEGTPRRGVRDRIVPSKKNAVLVLGHDSSRQVIALHAFLYLFVGNLQMYTSVDSFNPALSGLHVT